MAGGLEELKTGVVVRGIAAGEAVTVVQAEWYGTEAVNLTYRVANGNLRNDLVFAGQDFTVETEASSGWRFDADGAEFRLAAEARRIRLAYLFDPRLAINLSVIDPLPHQVQAVYGVMLHRQPLRFALCDDPGAGKTIMAGLYIKELMLRGDLRRCLIVAPGGLVVQWQDELRERFGLWFELLSKETIDNAATADAFTDHHLLIARLDHLSRNAELVERLRTTEWDLAVVDEAHRLSAHRFGGEVKETGRYRLGKVLGGVARHLLLITATPHSGNEDDFALWLALLDPDQFEGRPTAGTAPIDASDLMRRMVKEKLLRMDGRPLFPERVAHTVPFHLTPLEMELYEQVTDYVREEMNRAQRLADAGQGRRGNRVGFAATVLQRRLASSPEAIYQSLVRRKARLIARLEEARVAKGTPVDDAEVDTEDLEDLDAEELEQIEDVLADQTSAAETAAEIKIEIEIVGRLEALAERVRRSGDDRKWTELVGLLEQPEMVDPAIGTHRKLIVFTEHRDTLNHLVSRLRRWFGRNEAVVAIHGGVHRHDRRVIQDRFTHNPECSVLVATDAAGEGINLQRSHLLINYDLPWNPNRIEQRFGRVHRIGQTQVCHLWNLVAVDTREGQVYERLLTKLDQQRLALGGQVWDVLGQALPGRALRELLIEAIRYGDRPDVQAKLSEVVDAHVGQGLAELVAEQALASDVLSVADVERIHQELMEAEARRLQPHYIRSWFAEAFARAGGRMAERETGRFEITRVPATLRQPRASTAPIPGRPTSASGVLDRYERITFAKERAQPEDLSRAELLAPGHPLVETVLARTLDHYGDTLRRGSILVDDADTGAHIRVIVVMEHAISDGRSVGAERHIVSRRMEFVELRADGTATSAGYAPYLDYRPLRPEETESALGAIDQPWLRDVDRAALSYAVQTAVPRHLNEVRNYTLERVANVRAKVRDRLSRQVTYWDTRAIELAEQAATGRQPRMNPARARARADDLAARLEDRLGELAKEEQLSALPPVIIGAAVIVPTGLLHAEPDGQPDPIPIDRDETDRRAVEAVCAAERARGWGPEVMAHNHPGYDIMSRHLDGSIRFIEVKGRVEGADVFMVTRNEILHSLNVPDAWVLALVEVGKDTESVRYLDQPFGDRVRLPFDTTAAVLSWPDYWARAARPEEMP